MRSRSRTARRAIAAASQVRQGPPRPAARQLSGFWQDRRGIAATIVTWISSRYIQAADAQRSSPAEHAGGSPGIAKRIKLLQQERGTALFDRVFEEGNRASNRRVPMEILGGLDGDQPARELIEQQEAEIAQKAGRPPRVVRSLMRTPKPEPRQVWE